MSEDSGHSAGMTKPRTTAFVATVRWDADSEYSDVEAIDAALQSEGYETRMASNNSQMLVMDDREKEDR